MRINFWTIFLDLVQNTCSVRFLYLLRLSKFLQSPGGHAKFPAEVPEDCRMLLMRRVWWPTSDRLETWPIPFGTNLGRSKQHHRSLKVWCNLPPLQVLTSALSRSLRVPKLCSDLDITLLYILIFKVKFGVSRTNTDSQWSIVQGISSKFNLEKKIIRR